MFKRTLLSFTMVAVLLGSLVFTASAAPGNDLRILPIIVNGHKVSFPDTEPYINADGRTMVPVRFVSEKLGADVGWQDDTRTVTVQYGMKQISMTIGSRDVTVDGHVSTLDTAAEMYEGRAMVPLRFVSEVLGSEVNYDRGAHAVQVMDADYRAKVDAGIVRLDPWGREYSDVEDELWLRLSDMEGSIFYDIYDIARPQSKKFMQEERFWDYKLHADQWSEHIKAYYAAQLNVDYRTIDEKAFTEVLLANMGGRSDVEFAQLKAWIKEYVAWVKKNKIITRGYADPEPSYVFGSGSLNRIWVPVKFKFFVLSAEDTSQVFLDNWETTTYSEPVELKKNVWYEGYASIRMDTNYATQQHRHYALATIHNMYFIGHHIYSIAN